MTEPDSASAYSKVEYWDKRYTSEAEYDWFETVFEACLQECLEALKHLDAGDDTTDVEPLRVLHLGCGNSRLCRELQLRWKGRRPLSQIAIDYSPVVIKNMEASHADLSQITWAVDDITELKHVADHSIDVAIDKGTMDAIQADKDDEMLDEKIDAMMKQVSRVLRKEAKTAATPASLFLQFTWEVPYYRFHYTHRPEYAWGTQNGTAKYVGDSDMYRAFTYRVI